jgi:release factor glutamine methyltransferase
MDVLRWMTSRFEERRLASPRLDAELLTAHTLATSRVQLYVQFDRPLTAPELAALRELVKRRQAGESVAYIVGKKEFFGLELMVDARVLVPRPDTETLVDEALARLPLPQPPAIAPSPESSSAEAPPVENAAEVDPPPPPPPPLKVADVGTGSGAIAIAIATQRPGARVFASDISPDALAVAQENATRRGCANITFVAGDLDAPLAALGPFDVIAANLPYIPTGDLAGLPPEVKVEPILALDGGPDGLDLVRRLVAAAPSLLVPQGALVLEIGAGQAQATAALLQQAGFIDIRLRRDLGAVERVVSGIKP